MFNKIGYCCCGKLKDISTKGEVLVSSLFLLHKAIRGDDQPFDVHWESIWK